MLWPLVLTDGAVVQPPPGVSAPVTGSGAPPIGAVGCRLDTHSIVILRDVQMTNSRRKLVQIIHQWDGR